MIGKILSGMPKKLPNRLLNYTQLNKKASFLLPKINIPEANQLALINCFQIAVDVVSLCKTSTTVARNSALLLLNNLNKGCDQSTIKVIRDVFSTDAIKSKIDQKINNNLMFLHYNGLSFRKLALQTIPSSKFNSTEQLVLNVIGERDLINNCQVGIPITLIQNGKISKLKPFKFLPLLTFAVEQKHEDAKITPHRQIQDEVGLGGAWLEENDPL